jgi:preprotein translocase subunit SecE
MNDREFPSLLTIVGIVAVVVALVILVFFGIGYLIGRLVL